MEEHELFVPDMDLSRILDSRMNYVDNECPCCGMRIRSTEAIINRRQSDEIELFIEQLKESIVDVQKCAIEIYGEEPRFIIFQRRLQKIQEQLERPRLTIIK